MNKKLDIILTILLFIALAISNVFIADKCVSNRMKKNKEEAELALKSFFNNHRYSTYATMYGEKADYSERPIKFYRERFNQRYIKVDSRFEKEIGKTMFRDVTSAYDINPSNPGWIIYSIYGRSNAFSEQIIYPYSGQSGESSPLYPA